MADKLPVLHTTYNFKPKNAFGYVKIYFECSPQDVVIEDSDKSNLLNADNMLQLLTQLVALINSKQDNILMAWSYNIDKNIVFPKGQFIYEQDTGILRIADGIKTYENLIPVKGSSTTITPEPGGGTGGTTGGSSESTITVDNMSLDKSIDPIFVYSKDDAEITVHLGTVEAKTESETPAEDAKSVFTINE